ncbi:MAG: tetraacyldisaccharide 4'-kinase [Candidatus Marinimicrobia bacterium]|nr:tetraacyldisaccharide 4'-kinase [Candidatus Neomarinimicrobiota bacterium]
MRLSIKAIFKLFLPIIAFPYMIATSIINWLYDKNILKAEKLSVPVISVGNITAGGTGKTPFVISLSIFLQNSGYKVGIISRGYRRKGKDQIIVSTGKGPLVSPHISGDEPQLIACKTKDAVIIADRDKVAAGKTAIEKYNCAILIIDDGYQHRRLSRDVNILLWDSYSNPYKEKVLPAGKLRESLHGLKRASLLVFTRTDTIPDNYKRFFREKRPDLKQYCSPISIEKIVIASSGNTLNLEDLKELSIFAFCGLGNPQQFFDTVNIFNSSKPITKKFHDHHKYNEKEIASLIEDAKSNNCGYLITTEKDSINFPEGLPKIDNLLLIGISLEIEENLKKEISTIISQL